MRIDWFFGPDRVPFVVDGEGRVRSAAATPFHGIVGLGMRRRIERDGLAPEAWLRNAHRLFDDGSEEPSSSELALLRRYADECATLSFAESAAAVRAYLAARYPPAREASRVEAWNVKEGHTSSVWRITLADGGAPRDEFALNVARDADGGGDLHATSLRMREIKRRCPELNLADVVDVATVSLDRAAGDAVEVVVTRNEWVPESLEVHPLHTPDGAVAEYVLVERFLTSEAAPAHIVSIHGRRCSEQERSRIEADLERFRREARTESGEAPGLDLGHGDVVWTGREAVVVALS